MRQLLLIVTAFCLCCSAALAADSLEMLQKELVKLERELPENLQDSASLDAKQEYVNRILELRDKISSLSEKEETSANNQAHEGRYLYLTGFYLYEAGVGYIPHPYAGKTVTVCAFNECGKKMDHRTRTTVDSYPQRIKPGEPFTITATTHKKQVKHAGLDLGSSSALLKKTGILAETAISGYDGPKVSVRNRPVPLNYGYGYKGDFEAEATSSITLEFVYKGYDEQTRSVGDYEYEVSKVIKQGIYAFGSKDPTGDIQRIRYDRKKEATGDPKHQSGFRFSVNNLTAIYDWADEGDEPANAKALPEDEPLIAKRDSGKDNELNGRDSNRNANRSQDRTDTSLDPLALAEQLAADGIAQDKRKKHIQYWLRKAQPVENAKPGVNLKFDQYGRLQGIAEGGRITLRGKPRTAGLSPEEYAWKTARKLGSLNLCTLEEYVGRKLAGRETNSCPSTMMPARVDKSPGREFMPNLVGKAAAHAKERLAKSVKIKWKLGSLTHDAAKEGIVEKQNPAAGRTLQGPVEIWVYRYSAKIVSVPDVTGMKYPNAELRLKREGLQAGIGRTFEPRFAEEAGKVVTQQIKPGSKVASGTRVTLDIVSGGLAQVVMPSVIGLPYDKATQKLRAAGLKARKKLGPYSSNPDQPGKVMLATVAAGHSVDLGSTITMTVYNTYSQRTASQPSSPKLPSRPRCPVGQTISSSGTHCVDIEPAYQRQQPAYNPDTERQDSQGPNSVENLLDLVDELADQNAQRRRQNAPKRPGGIGYDGIFSGGGGASDSSPGGNTNSGVTTNRSREQMRSGGSGGNNCLWDGGHDMFGVPGAEVRVYCKCNGQTVDDSRCPGPKPSGNYYYNQ